MSISERLVERMRAIITGMLNDRKGKWTCKTIKGKISRMDRLTEQTVKGRVKINMRIKGKGKGSMIKEYCYQDIYIDSYITTAYH